MISRDTAPLAFYCEHCHRRANGFTGIGAHEAEFPGHDRFRAADPCAACGRPDVLDAADATAHWLTPDSSEALWSCGGVCAVEVEAQRRPDGRLPRRRAAVAR